MLQPLNVCGVLQSYACKTELLSSNRHIAVKFKSFRLTTADLTDLLNGCSTTILRAFNLAPLLAGQVNREVG